MEELFLYVQQHADLAPWLIFGLLLLAGLNIPISEDGMLFICALLSLERPDLLWQLFAAVYLGSYFSDLICYTFGRTLGPRLWEIKWFARMVSRDKVDRVSEFYEKYGVLTLFFGRFIPFGVRNALFLTAGIGAMDFRKFALADFCAVTVTSSFYFWLYYTYGRAVVDYVKQGNVVLFSVAAVAVLVFVVRSRRKAKGSAQPPESDSTEAAQDEVNRDEV